MSKNWLYKPVFGDDTEADVEDDELRLLENQGETQLKRPSPPHEQNAGPSIRNPYHSLRDIAKTTAPYDEDADNLALYQPEIKRRKKVSQILSNLVRMNFSSAISANDDPFQTVPLQRRGGVKQGTLVGVYLPTIQNIFGVTLFLRLTWIIGTAGVPQTLLIMFLCTFSTMITAVSMSAIATNGVVPAGGSYFMVSRTLGPEFGGAVGLMFYLGNTFAVALYSIGSIELLLTYILPSLSAFGHPEGEAAIEARFNNIRLFGSVFLVFITSIVAFGVKHVSRVGNVCLFLVVVAITCIFLGCFSAPSIRDPSMCLIDGITMTSSYPGFCNASDASSFSWITPNSSFQRVDGIPGLGSGIISDNLGSHYLEKGQSAPNKPSQSYQVVSDISTSFLVLLEIFFPAVKGIMAGSNRSGDLKDASRSIPKGTIAAILTTSSVYFLLLFFLGGAVRGELLRDKYGQSIGNRLVIAEIAWPSPWIVVLGAFLATLGQSMQNLVGAPRLLQAVAKDNLIPVLSVFEKVAPNGEPVRALIFTAFLAEFGILIASLDYVAPIVAMFNLMCFAFVNLACVLQSLLKAPNWRPRFQYYHWALSAFGVLLNLVIMFASSWLYALLTIGVAIVIYEYIEFKGAAKEWGDGLRGLSMQAARYSLLRLEDTNPHTKNWRPQLLVLCKLTDHQSVEDDSLLHFSGLLKGGKGLVIVSSVIEGDFISHQRRVFTAEKAIKYELDKLGVQGFTEVIVSHDVIEGVRLVVQGAGLGALKHNTVLIGWPDNWRERGSEDVFVDAIRAASAPRLAILVPKNAAMYPHGKEEVEGTIDVWWVVNDGGMLILLAFLLQQDKIWRKCKLRIFTIAESSDDSIQVERDLKLFLYHLRIDAEVGIVELHDAEISSHTVERVQGMRERVPRAGKRKQRIFPPFSKKSSRNPTMASNDSSNQSSNESPVSGAHVGINPSNDISMLLSATGSQTTEDMNLHRMDTCVKLNKIVNDRSKGAQLVLLNLPSAPEAAEENATYMEFLEALTEGLNRVVLVRGGGHEVVTIFS